MKNGCEDWDLWLTFYENGLMPYKIPQILYFYRLHQDKSRSDIVENHSNEMYKELVKNHIELDLNNEETVNKLFRNSRRKLKQFRKLFNVSLAITLIEFLIITIMTIILIG